MHYITAEISRRALRHNVEQLRKQVPADCRVCGVVKANAYGHGVGAVLETLAGACDCLAVATVAEAMEIRSLGYTGGLMTTLAIGVQAGGEQQAAAAEAIRHDVELTVTDMADMAVLRRLGVMLGKRPGLHVKVDTGMGRSGALPDDAAGLIEAVRDDGELRLAGIMTHFASSDERDISHSEGQLTRFERVLRRVGRIGGAVRHCANSAAVANLPHSALDMIRPGLAVYGYQPGEEMRARLELRPCLRLTAPIIQMKRLPAGSTCGYGCTHRLARDSRVGIVPAGYADGLPRCVSGLCSVRVEGKAAAVLGRISMDQIIIDLTHVPGACVGDKVELISPDEQAPNSVENLARLAGTIPYEITCGLGRRVTYKAVEDF